MADAGAPSKTQPPPPEGQSASPAKQVAKADADGQGRKHKPQVLVRGQSVLTFNNVYAAAGDTFVEPDTVFAQDLSRHRMFEEGRADLLRTSSEDFASLGYGIALYFQFLHMLVNCFVMVFVVTLPVLIFCLSGRALSARGNNFGYLAQTTLGNIGSGLDCADNSSLVQQLVAEALNLSITGDDGNSNSSADCVERVGFWFGWPLALSDVMFIVATLDSLSSLGILLLSFQLYARLAACVRASVSFRHPKR
jgi:hypothetical protein